MRQHRNPLWQSPHYREIASGWVSISTAKPLWDYSTNSPRNDMRFLKSIMIGTIMFKLIRRLILLSLSLAACSSSTVVPATVTPSPSATQTAIPATLTPTAIPSSTETPLPTATPEPLGCQKPPDDYTRVHVNGETLNLRTLSMLGHAQALYGGEIELTGYAITQGSYSTGVSASFGTHDGGGAVDISVLRRETYTVLWDDIGPLLRAMRAAGFAAWLREYGELYPDSPIHIHAIAVGDQELSPAAQEQLTGPAGYFRGFNGLPIIDNGGPAADRYGGPIICQWMIELGYYDMR